ncbi:SDR family NAD(P)-dependent oxidoreductase [Flavobacterium sp.]|uniref:SDR family NAD(P)-dependent oxidoreductase n=1 Tax=Flavobacterium sp. TaxID=239 RepID=UPI003F699597
MQEKRKKISILGIGWLGFPLAKKLIEIGYEVKGSTTSENKLEHLKNNNIQPYQIELSEKEIKGNIEAFLNDSEFLIIDIPPKLRSNPTENFEEKIKLLTCYIEKSTVKNVLFVSSTSVYVDDFPIAEIDENSIPNPDSESSKQLLQTEEILLTNKNFQTTILRFGGLIGEDRHPIKFLAGKTNVENPDAPINLIHQKDCIGIICAILNQVQNDNIIFNAVAPHHPTRKEYYQKKAENSNLPLPIFAKNQESIGKLISSTKIETVLNYRFKKEI